MRKRPYEKQTTFSKGFSIDDALSVYGNLGVSTSLHRPIFSPEGIYQKQPWNSQGQTV